MVLCSVWGLDTWTRLSRDGVTVESDIVETGCCDTSQAQHRWQSLNEDWAYIVDS